MSTIGETERSEQSLFAQFNSEVAVTTVSAAKPTAQDAVYLRVAVPSTATTVRVSFDPVSVEEGRQTRVLNQSVRLGFVPPTTSTR
jgi:hypothetical protein